MYQEITFKMIKKIFNIIRKEKPKITFWSIIDGLEKIVPVLPAKEVIPDWWKNAEKFVDNSLKDKGTVKNCPSFPEYLSQGYVVPLWCDLNINVQKDKCEWTTTDKIFNCQFHTDEQYKNYLPEYAKNNVATVLKPDCPWRVKTSDGYSVMQLPLYYDYNSIFEVLPGVIWSDIYHELNQQMIIKKYGEFFIKRGTPLAVYFPFKRENLDFEIQGPNEINRKWEYETYAMVRTKFRGAYKIQQNITKKCPFKI